MGDSLDEIMAKNQAATAFGCCYDEDCCTHVEQKSPQPENARTERLPASAASRRKSVRFLNENPNE